ncbi:MAG: DUF6305 family protein [Candidatus Aminicenantes bacterium]
MRRIHTLSAMFLVLFLLIIFLPPLSYSQPELPPTDFPVLVTSCGQSPGPVRIKAIFKRMNLEPSPETYLIVDQATAEDLKITKETGSSYKTVIIVMGSSLKAMGAAGISIDDEIDRISKLIAEARRQKITIIGAHIEGMARRAQGAAVGDNTDELSIDAVGPHSDLLIITKDGNTDGRFTIISKDKDIPMIEADKMLDLIPVFEKIFKK